MAASRNFGAAAPGWVTPASETARVASAGRIEEQEREQVNFRGTGTAAQAALVIEGEDYAQAWLERLQADAAQPGELAVLLSFPTGEMLHGACRVIEKALGGRRHA